MEAINGSLKRTKLDYFDIVYAHRYDVVTPLEETVRAFTQLIRDGKAFYWGTRYISILFLFVIIYSLSSSFCIKHCIVCGLYIK